MELAYRLLVEETPFIQKIRNNVIVFLTPVVEVDGREKVVDNYYYQKKTGKRMPLIYWGNYVAHDNNRDGLGVGLNLTQNILQDVPRVAPDGAARPARIGDLSLHVHRRRALQHRRSTRCSPTSGGCCRSTKSPR